MWSPLCCLMDMQWLLWLGGLLRSMHACPFYCSTLCSPVLLTFTLNVCFKVLCFCLQVCLVIMQTWCVHDAFMFRRACVSWLLGKSSFQNCFTQKECVVYRGSLFWSTSFLSQFETLVGIFQELKLQITTQWLQQRAVLLGSALTVT